MAGKPTIRMMFNYLLLKKVITIIPKIKSINSLTKKIAIIVTVPAPIKEKNPFDKTRE